MTAELPKKCGGFSLERKVAVTQNVSLAQTGARAIHLDSANRQRLATTSAIGTDGSSFNVTRTSTPATQPVRRSTARGR
jgi:hypothetical protein